MFLDKVVLWNNSKLPPKRPDHARGGIFGSSVQTGPGTPGRLLGTMGINSSKSSCIYPTTLIYYSPLYIKLKSIVVYYSQKIQIK